MDARTFAIELRNRLMDHEGAAFPYQALDAITEMIARRDIELDAATSDRVGGTV